MNLIERQVHFRVRDVQFPEVGDLLWDLYANDVLEGKVIELTSSATDGQPFAVVQLGEGRPLVVVAVDHLLP